MSTATDEGGYNVKDTRYWNRNLRVLAVLLAAWFVVSYLLGIVFVEPLNNLRIPGTGFPVGFWFAQQGAIYGFLVIILLYVRIMNRIDAEYETDEVAETDGRAGLDRTARGLRGEP